jgi:hypothetical protein
MWQRRRPSLAAAPRTLGVALVSAALAIAILAAPAGRADDITVYRCKDASGNVTMQDSPCAAGTTGSARTMTRPQDPPPDTTARTTRPQAPPAPAPEEVVEPVYVEPPPPMFECTDYDGAVRYSETYRPSNRCVPLAVLGYDVGPGAAAATCRWVEESCLRLDDESSCRHFKQLLVEAKSAALHAFSDTAAFRKSEVERLTRIVNESCR